MSDRYYFGVYHWRRRFRSLAVALAALLTAGLAWRRSRSRGVRALAAVAAVVGLRRGTRAARTVLSPPPWAVERGKYAALARELPFATAERALDVGCGTGRSFVGLAPAVPESCDLTVLDVFDDRVILGNGPVLARRNAAAAGLDAAVVAGDAGRLPATDDSQDVVTACRVLHDLPADVARDALTEAHRVVRPGGKLGVLELPITHGDVDADPVTYWRRLIEAAGFEVDTVEEPGRGGEYIAITATP